mgnify:CR=1 FL=1
MLSTVTLNRFLALTNPMIKDIAIKHITIKDIAILMSFKKICQGIRKGHALTSW